VQEGLLPIQDLYDLPRAHMMAKMAAVSFYFGEVNLASFENKFGIPLEAAYPDAVSYVLARGLMEYTESRNGPELSIPGRSLSLTKEGAKHFNGTIALFFAPSVQSILLSGDFDFSRNRRAALAVRGG
jgi:oxygen-independent coproporphyrinogen-3 oxidase